MKLENDALWQAAQEINEYIHTILDNFSEESKWTTVSKLRDRGFDITSNIAEACGSVDPRDKTHSYGLARRDLFSIKNAFIMADSSGEHELNPAIMRKLDELATLLDAQISKSDGEIQQYLNKFSPEGPDLMSNLNDLQTRAQEIRQKYDQLNVKDGHTAWSGVDYMAGFVGDVGDLAKVVMTKEGKRRGDNIDEKLRHELGDCLWSLLVIANQYDIDLESAFTGTMDELDERLAA